MFNVFKKKKKENIHSTMLGPPPQRERGRMIVPVNEVKALSSRGVPEPEIIRTLRSEGYSIEEIDQAMKEALRSRVSGEQPPLPETPTQTMNEPVDSPIPHPGTDVPPLPEEEPPAPIPPPPPTGGIPTGDSFYREPQPPPIPPPVQKEVEPPKKHVKGLSRREVEEIVEVMLDEKMVSVKDKLREFQNKFQQMENKIDSIKGEIEKIRMEKSNELKGIESKIDNYTQRIDELGGRLESMEKALKDTLSPMLQSLRSLSETIKILKEKERS